MSWMIAWLIAFIILVIIEIVTLGLTTIWFAGGALVALLAAALGVSIYGQLFLFFAVSILLLYFTRPLALRYFNKGRTKTNVDGIVGQQVRVIEEINNKVQSGHVLALGQEWMAQLEDVTEVAPEGSNVTVIRVEGVKLIVSKGREGEC